MSHPHSSSPHTSGHASGPSSHPFDQKAPIPGIKHIIAVGSGKGGVGKSTIATNLALALSEKSKVALLDGDIYGPSIPRMLGLLNQRPQVNPENQFLIPLIQYGIKVMSIGFLIEEEAAVIWRGPMLFKALDQFLHQVQWGELDYLIIDLPPGTGDIQISLVQKVSLSGVITVCTPQNMALSDVKKAINMFDQVHVPHLGVVENMSYLRQEGSEKIQLFPKGELNSFLDAKKISKLAEVPFHTSVALSCETGIPIVIHQPNSEETRVFKSLAQKVMEVCPL